MPSDIPSVDWDRIVWTTNTRRRAQLLGDVPAGGGDLWVVIDGEKCKYTAGGMHIRYPHEPAHGRVFNPSFEEIQLEAAKRIRKARAERKQRELTEQMGNHPLFGIF